MIFGFGEYHYQQTRNFCKNIVKIINTEFDVNKSITEKNLKNLINSEIDKIPQHEFNGKKYAHLYLQRVNLSFFYKNKDLKNCVIVVDGTYSHYDNDHPMSPDGFACLSIPFCITLFRDDVWKNRHFISV